jgi:Peptidase propeptide and YPEB domain
MRLALSLAILGLSTVAAYAATSSDQAKVEPALKAQSYTHWKTIVLDNGTWEVDDAINTAGRQFDLRIDSSSLKVTSTVPE